MTGPDRDRFAHRDTEPDTTDVPSSSRGLLRGATAAFAALVVAMGCTRRASQEPQPPGPDEAWIASTCYVAHPDTTGWKRYEFADISIWVPPEYHIGGISTRSVSFRNATATLSLSVSTDPRPPVYSAGRPDRASKEVACEALYGGYRGVVSASYDYRRYTLSAEWDGSSFWEPDDWRKKLRATISTGRLRDATALRDALHTIRAKREMP